MGSPIQEIALYSDLEGGTKNLTNTFFRAPLRPSVTSDEFRQRLTFLREGNEYKLYDVVMNQQDNAKQIQSRDCIWRVVLNQFCIYMSIRKPW